jgi:S-adenosylmethionine:tRNA ribosyltransferase-isomerase
MPSAGRPFTTDLVTSAISGGVIVAPITLHAGVSSFEDHESPGEERYRVPASTAAAINALRSTGGRVVAVGTTVVRALETVTDEAGNVHPGEGTTDLVLGAERGLRATDGLITGWHEPRSSHLRLLEALTGHDFLEKVYEVAVEHGYLWHEFGDSALFLP